VTKREGLTEMGTCCSVRQKLITKTSVFREIDHCMLMWQWMRWTFLSGSHIRLWML